jgi:hypothetical protein
LLLPCMLPCHHRDGTSRQLAFVGFRSVEDATAAKDYFDHTFMDASRISVEVRGWSVLLILDVARKHPCQAGEECNAASTWLSRCQLSIKSACAYHTC